MKLSNVEKAFIKKIIQSGDIKNDEVFVVQKIFKKVLDDTDENSVLSVSKDPGFGEAASAKGAIVKKFNISDTASYAIQRYHFEMNGYMQIIKQQIPVTSTNAIDEYIVAMTKFNVAFDAITADIMKSNKMDTETVVITYKEILFDSKQLLVVYTEL